MLEREDENNSGNTGSRVILPIGQCGQQLPRIIKFFSDFLMKQLKIFVKI
jgi:hypothetical protein